MHKDFPKTNEVKKPHEIGDDKSDLLNLISKLELGDTKWQKTFNNIQYKLWNR